MYIIFDIGATKTRITFAENGESFEEPTIFETAKNFEESFKLFKETAKNLADSREIKKIIGGMSRMVLQEDCEKFKKDLEKEFGCEVIVENDSAMAGLGEANFGAGKNCPIVAYLTVSTGVGGTRIVNGKIDERAIGFEPGKQIMDIETEKNLEDMISGGGILKNTGQDPKNITDQNFWDKLADILAIGLHNIIVEWSPDCVVVGGGMIIKENGIPLEKAEKRLKEILKIFPVVPPIKKAELGDFSGLWGALAYLKNYDH